MKAIQVPQPGGPEAMQLVDVPEPRPAAGEALVEIHAIGVNFIDVYLREGRYPLKVPTLGQEAAGVVREVGDGVAGLAPGDRVAYAAVQGSYAELAVVPADRLVPLPDGVSFDQGAAAMLQG